MAKTKREEILRKIVDFLEEEGINSKNDYHVIVSITKKAMAVDFCEQSGFVHGAPNVLGQSILKIMNDNPALKTAFALAGLSEMMDESEA